MTELKIISLGSSPDRNQRRIWRKIEEDAFKNNPNFVGALGPSGQKDTEKEFFVLYSNGNPIGRAAATLDRNWIERKKENVGFIDDFAINHEFKDHADLLIKRCLSILREKKVEGVIVRSNGFVALLEEGYELLPPIGFPYNPPWYIDLFLKNGFVKYKEWGNFRFKLPSDPPDISEAKKLLESLDAEFKTLNMGDKRQIIEYSNLVQNSFLTHFGYNPREFISVTDAFPKRILMRVISYLGRIKIYVGRYRSGGIFGFVSYHPNYNAVLKSTGLPKLGFNPIFILKLARSLYRCDKAQIGGLAVDEAMRGRGIASTLANYLLEILIKEGYKEIDLGPILTENLPVAKVIERIFKNFGNMIQMKYYTLQYTF